MPRGEPAARVLPGFGLSMGISVLFISLVLLLPITGLFGQLAELSLPSIGRSLPRAVS
ncbi:hypothetical protein HSBAA_42490 [Vreelandella sulfidaeris]|uniref:Molybdate ABC transporter permease subunit n=1 Tax=Vreelandella sulfidaeris TaxID=115553 RepID=A0A455UCC4_9GAMM|nr:hypothetical protein HSBAA_42490 [Halomonas sulfidaeris]